MIKSNEQTTNKDSLRSQRVKRLARRARNTTVAALAATGLSVGVAQSRPAQSERVVSAKPAIVKETKKASAEISKLAQSSITGIARKVLELARSGHGQLLRPDNTYMDEVVVDITAPIAPGYSNQKGLTKDHYAVFMDIPAPANGRYTDRRRLNPKEMSELNPESVKSISMQDGYATQLAYDDISSEGWVFRAGYSFQPNGPITYIRASTNPKLPHEQRLTIPKLTAANQQSEQLIQDAITDQPINFMAGPAFPHVPNENDDRFPAA